MNKHSCSIATITWARDSEEEKLLRESLLELSKLNLPTYITDGGSNEDFINYVRSFPNFTLLKSQSKGLWPQVHTSLMAAYNAGEEFIIYSEPDKINFFKDGLPAMLNNVSVDHQSGIIIAVRSLAGFESYPAFQQMTETTINNCCTEVTGIDTDYTYGPFILNRTVIPYLESLKASIGWGWRTYTAVMAKRLGFKVEAFEGPFFCPIDQRSDDANERVYRMKQLCESVEGAVLASKDSRLINF